jgi:hypothetical protein
LELVLAIQLKPERLAEGGKRPFGGIGFGSFKRDIVNLAGGGSSLTRTEVARASVSASVSGPNNPSKQ